MGINRDRERCKDCNFKKLEYCLYVKIDGYCSLNGRKVAKDYTFGRSLNDNTIYR